jgi:hypothetical protein
MILPITMTPRVCLCCGESISKKTNDSNSSGNQNLCASCGGLADGFLEPTANGSADVPRSRMAFPEDVNQIQDP